MNFANPSLDINGTTFGPITSTNVVNGTGPRQMQFALRYEFYDSYENLLMGEGGTGSYLFMA